MTSRPHTDTSGMSQPKPITMRPPLRLPSCGNTRIPLDHGSSHEMGFQPNWLAGLHTKAWWYKPIATTLTNARAAPRWLSAQLPDVEEVRQVLYRIAKDHN